jgi:hypothetical protein
MGETVSVHVDPAKLSASSGLERRAMLAHVAGCASCRQAFDPAILFSLLALAPIPESTLDAVSIEVARHAGRDRSSVGALLGAGATPRLGASAAVVALALLCGYAVLQERPVAPPPVFASKPRADVEVQSGRGVSQVIDLTVGETQIVMVYNGELKL